ncbi:hypothetical protein P7F60_06750 [Rhizobium sp. YJ-22]|uniref:hypothetical protein n=1 Tax=Rhizobium sp. YJ-22 TaxID=3037556 RepID=UPI001AD1BE30|nr:hypothetical protein [Rhizobium sp. YJ-22]MBN9033593.1 hypothetical protein [Hyphomicrobiales bacterium]MDG3576077.1 hypothetical protein [Rhizobium sp. YJ-22]
MTTITTAATREPQVNAALKPVLYTVFAAKLVVAGLLVAAVNLPTPSAHADQTVVAGDF